MNAPHTTFLGRGSVLQFEIAPMRNLSHFVGSDKEIVTIRPIVEGETPDLWSVLARFDSGRCSHLSDRRNKTSAMAFARRFRRKLREIAPIGDVAIIEYPARKQHSGDVK